MTDWLNVSWKLLMVRGALGLVFGIVAMVWPIETALALALLWGFWALVDGIGSIVQAFQPGSGGGTRLLLVVMGVIALLAAFFAITSPGMAAATLIWVLGIWLMVRGFFELFGAFSSRTAAPRWLLLVSAALDLVLGVLFVTHPGKSAVGLAFLLGLFALLWGVVLLAAGFMTRRLAHDVADLEASGGSFAV